ncbi:ABC transporter substrate-binding protein [Fodinicurvata sp. EGI_FJ10296]|uniref:ABC transporter substrate-binding protein n=1 Tax=Fodinicurvata sp. EGI_FJ10296 TaxID=3231908 RepID=UPI00345612B9
MKRIQLIAATALTSAVGFSAAPAQADSGSLVLYCSPQVEWCEAMAAAFEAETGISVSSTRRSSGETYAQLQAERDNPQGDIWWGGTGDPHLQAAQEGLTEAYDPPNPDELQDWALSQHEASDGRTIGIYAGALGWGYNTQIFEQRDLPRPACWEDLTNPAYEGEIQIASPFSSGTAYTALATLVQLMGEDEAFEYLTELDANVSEYTQSGAAPVRATGRGEAGIGIVFMHDAIAEAAAGLPVEAVAPCEGTGYEIGSMSIIAGGPNPDNARAWYDWALTAEAQSIAATVDAFQVPSNMNAEVPPEAPDLEEIKLIDYDFATYGSTEMRDRLLERWDDEIGSLR